MRRETDILVAPRTTTDRSHCDPIAAEAAVGGAGGLIIVKTKK